MALIFMLGVALFTFLFLLVSRKSFFVSNNHPPGQNGWPIIGETLEFVAHPAKFICDRMSKFSPDIFQTSFAGEKLVIFCGPSGNKFIHCNEDKFSTWLPPSFTKALELNNIGGKSPSIKLFREQTHKYLRIGHIHDYVSFMDTMAREHMEACWMPFNEVKVQHLSKDYGFSLAWHLLISRETDAVKDLAKTMYTMAERLISVPVNLPGTSYNQALKASKTLRGQVSDLIKKKKAKLLSKADLSVDGNDQDLLSRLLLALKREDNILISDEELASFMVALLFAGYSTTSIAITFTIGHLAECPDVYAKVLHEQLDIAQSKEGELLTLKDIQKMKYTWNVVCESMRLKPPGFGGFREAQTDISFAGFTIPRGWKVHWNVYSTHMDPTYFQNPEKFDPSRFEKKLPPHVFVPFGGGAHMCYGMEFARMEILVYLHNVVSRFKLTKANSNEKIIYTPDPISVEGLRIRLQPHAK